VRWSVESRRHRRLRELGWHEWFAWHPVLVDREWVWLETVQRKMHCGMEICIWQYEYR
jgi:hypothetical protein